MNGPYTSGADLYWAAGWRGILPLPPKAKKFPPKTYTGGGGIDPSYPDVRAWADGDEGYGNICLRMPLDVIGIDVDAYDDKPGADTFAAAERDHGRLAPTWRTTSRDDGVSGIRLYRVPPGMAWDQIGPGIETIQRNHRYAVVWPSVHPEGRTYRWITPDGVISTQVPHIDDLPMLSSAWVSAYVRGEAADIARNNMPGALAAAWLAGLPGAKDEPCRRMSDAATADAVALRSGHGSAHDAACQATGRFVRLASEGHPGVLRVMGAVHKAFTDNTTNPRRGGNVRSPAQAEEEWRDLVVSAVNLVSADGDTSPSCDCEGQLTALIVNDPTPPQRPTTDGSTALATQPDTAGTDDTDTDPDDDNRTSWWPRDLQPILDGEQTEPPPTVLTRDDDQPLWYPGKINGLIGESESGKTWVALEAVQQELRGGRPVLYLDFEDAAPGIVSRLMALGLTRHDLAHLHYADPAESLHAAASEDLTELLGTNPYSLIVVDGFNAAMTLLGLDLMSNTDVTKFFQLLLRPLAKTGAAVAYVDHISKHADDDSKGGIGAQAKRAMTTGCVVKVRVGEPFGRGMKGLLKLIVDKDRAGHVRGASSRGRDAGTAELVSNVDDGSVTVTLAAPDMASPQQRDQGRRTVLMERISTWLQTDPERTSLTAVRSAMPGRNDDADAALEALVKDGWVAREDAGRGFAHRLIKPYSVAEDLAETAHRATVPDPAPTVPGAGLPKPSDDRAHVPHLYRWGTVAVPEADDRTQPSEPTMPGHGETSDCNGCGRTIGIKTLEALKGYCSACATDRKK